MAVALAVAALIAGKPAQIACDVPATAIVDGWTTPTISNVIHMKATHCAGLTEKPGTYSFASSISLVIHESAHLRGVRLEACAELWANLVVFDVLSRFYRVPMFSALSWRVGEQVAALTRARPAEYQPTPTACEHEPH